jgi:hypothetical protein
MTNLEYQQRGMLNLVKGRDVSPGDPYLQRVSASPGLAILRGTALFWRAFQLQDQCQFTARLLARLGWFDSLVASYFDHNATSPFVEELSRGFLRSLQLHDDALVRAMAQFEYAALEVKSGSAETFEITWDRHPDLVFRALEIDGELPAAEEGNVYTMQVDRKLPGMIACTREYSAGPSTAPGRSRTRRAARRLSA